MNIIILINVLLVKNLLTEEVKSNHKSRKYKIGHRVKIIKYKNIFIKGCTKNWWKEISVIDSVLNIILWTYKMQYLNRETVIGSFSEKEILLSTL